MILETKGLRIFIYQDAIDMRCGFDRLSYFAREVMRSKIDMGHVYLFFGKNRKRIKALYFDGSGLVLVHKRMEKNSFMHIGDLDNIKEITLAELKLIFHGSVLRKVVVDRMMHNAKPESFCLPRGDVVESKYASP
jgi:transposase